MVSNQRKWPPQLSNLLETNKIPSPRRLPAPRLYQQLYDYSTMIILRYTSKHVFKLHFLQ